MKRILSFLLALALLVPLCPVSARAAQTVSGYVSFTVTADPGLPGNDELFAGYANQLFQIQSASASGIPAGLGISAGRKLSGDLKILYDALVPILRQIADGERKETAISIGRTISYFGQILQPDAEAVFTGSGLTAAGLQKLLTALLSDLPYELYWYDKTIGCSTEIYSGSTMYYVKLKFTVAENYRSGDYTTNTAKTSAAATAVKNARHIVNCLEDAPDYSKLMGYADAICHLTDYDYAAASKGSYSRDDDPWQLIHVFDGDPDTKAVCEGYAKAYLYLCDLSDFRGDVTCNTVTGTMNGDTHMWNIVTLDGKNYLVDVTNTDGGGHGNALLLAGCVGSAAKSYQVSKTAYRYDSATLSFWGSGTGSILNISRTPFSPSAYTDHDHDFGSWKRYCSATLSRIGIKSRSCSDCGYLDIYCSSAKELSTPSLSISTYAASGKPKLSWKAVDEADVYRVYRATSKSGSYKRIKSTSSTSYTDTDAVVGKKYYYKVIALDNETGKTSGYSSVVSQVCDLPQPTVSITGSSATGKPIVKWETVEGAAKYYIYRATSKNGAYKHVKTAVSGRSFEDSTAKAGTNYYYKVKAVYKDTAANSACSSVVNRVCDLPRPVVSIKLNSAGAPYLTWKEVSGAKGYEVFRSESKSGDYTSLGTTTSLKYADKTAEEGVKYYYKVRALHKKASANSAYSSVKYITAK